MDTRTRDMPGSGRSVGGGTAPGVLLFSTAIVVGSSVSFSVSTVTARMAFERGAVVETIVLGRLTIGAFVLWSLVAFLRIPIRPLGRRSLLLLALGVLPSTQVFLLYRSIARIPVTVATLLLYTYPALVTLFVLTLRKEHVNPGKIVALGLSACGLVLVLGLPSQRLAPAGIAFGLLAATVLAAWIVIADGVTSEVPPLLSASLLLSGGAASYGIVSLLTETDALRSNGWAWSIPIGVTAAIALLLILIALQHLPPTTVSIGSTVEPLSTSVISAMILGETLRLPQIFGGLLILAGVISAVRERANG